MEPPLCRAHSHSPRHSQQDPQSTSTPTPLPIRNALPAERRDNNSQDFQFIILLTVRKSAWSELLSSLPSLSLCSGWCRGVIKVFYCLSDSPVPHEPQASKGQAYSTRNVNTATAKESAATSISIPKNQGTLGRASFPSLPLIFF